MARNTPGQQSGLIHVTPLRAVAQLAAIGLFVGGCGDSHRKAGNADACKNRGDPQACLRFLKGLVPRHSVTLTTEIPQQVASTCRAAQRQTRLVVFCPSIIPAGGVVNDPDLYGLQVVTSRSYSASFNNGQYPGHIHWEFGAIKGPITKLWVFDRRQWEATGSPTAPTRLGSRHYLGRVIVLYRFPDNDGQLQGHDFAAASEGGISYFVSLHGHATGDADIVMLLAILLSRASH